MPSRFTAAKSARIPRGGKRLTPLAFVMYCAVAEMAMTGCTSYAQTETQAQVIQFDIPGGSIADALNRLAQQADVAISLDDAKVRDLRTHGLHGSYSVAEGFDMLLRDSGYAIGKTGAGYILVPVSRDRSAAKHPDEEATLPAVVVHASEKAEEGYVAHDSSIATKTDTPLIELPQSISVVTRQQMNDEQPQDVSQALRYTPGIFSEPEGVAQVQNGSTGMVLRGFQADAYLDGLTGNVLGRTIMDPYLLQQLEVVGGPNGALYGQGKPGGLVNMTSKLPLSTASNEVQVGFGNDARYEAKFDFSGPINPSGTLLYRLTGIAYSENTQTDFISEKRVAIAPAITWQPDADTSLTLLGKYINDPDTGAYSAVPAYGTVLPNPNGKIPVGFFSGDPNYNTASQNLLSVGYIFDHRFNDVWSVHQNFRFERNETNDAYATVGTLSPRDWSTLTRGYSINRYTADSAMLDNQAQAQFKTGEVSHDVLIGLDYQHYSLDKYGLIARAGSFPSIDIFAPVYYQTMAAGALQSATTTLLDETQSQIGTYAQDQVSWRQWRLLFGGREDWAKSPERTSVLTPPLQSDHKFTWHTGLVYLFDNGLAPYISYSTSFSPSVGASFSGQQFVPTTAQQYEVGFKYQPKHSNSFFTAAAYNLTQQNVLTTDTDHPGYSIQTGAIRSRGIELSQHTSLTRGLGLIGSVSYINGINTSSNATATGIRGATVSTQGMRPAGVPAWMASLRADYTMQSGTMAGLGMSAGIRFLGSSYGDAANSFKVPAYALFDASVRYDFERLDPSLKGLSGQLNATNLFNKTYVSSCSASSTCYFGIGRTIYASVKYKW